MLIMASPIIATSCVLMILLMMHPFPSDAFEWSTGGRGLPELDRHAIAGLWRLTPRNNPMKEFTVYPKRPVEREPEVLLMLKEDGSFLKYNNQLDDEEETTAEDVDASWNKYSEALKKKDKNHLDQNDLQEDLMKGTWDFVDGKLILAADRPSNDKSKSDNPLFKRRTTQDPDTLLVGRLVVNVGTSLQYNPVIRDQKYKDNAVNTTTNNEETTELTASLDASSDGSTNKRGTQQQANEDSLDVHLSVPKGSVKVGRFFYPKNHPSFFEQPMFQPRRQGAFMLQQVLGNLNAKMREREEIVEKYQPSVFYNKTFLLTSHPIQTRRPKGNKRWSIKYNKFVEDPPSKEAAKAAEEEQKRAVPIRVMQVAFHANNTFSTVAGLGEAILRGKFDVIGQDKDQLWMQVWRFGFGRSVSGSVYSEGRSLTHEDAKTYWGTIGPETRDGDSKDEGKDPKAVEGMEASATSETNVENEDKPQRLEVKGSVMFGWGLEPMPVARFIMRETTPEVDSLDMEDDDDDDEDEEEDEDDNIESKLEDVLKDDIGDGIDWSLDDDGAFQ